MDTVPSSAASAPKWQPIGAYERRVLGVLVEKAKTTPDAYPLTLNSLRVGCNQKSNRHPLYELEEDRVQDAVDRLRSLGAVIEVQGGGRTAKYRHLMYEWLGVEKAESAVMTELLLRGAQTEGELRARVARMEPIADLPALRTVLASLRAKGLVVSLTPEGRGCVVSHTLYLPREMEKVRAEAGAMAHAAGDEEVPQSTAPRPAAPLTGAPHRAGPSVSAGADVVAEFRREMSEFREELARLRRDIDDIWTNLTAANPTRPANE